MNNRLLILACSRRKRSSVDLLPAIERYNGPTFQVVRRFLHQQHDRIVSLDIQILSAKFGLISSDTKISDYDQRMTLTISQKLHSSVISALQAHLETHTYQEMLICVGQDYLKALHGCQNLGISTQIVTGGLGKKLSILHDWLYGKPPEFAKQSTANRHPKIRGIEVKTTPTQVIDIVKKAIATHQLKATKIQSWYVLVEDHRIAPKWLVSQLTELPVSEFVTADACRVLLQLGIEVRRV